MPGAEEIESAILALLCQRDAGKTICPSEAARAVFGDAAFRAHMDEVRAVAFTLADRGIIEVTQRGAVVDGRTTRGPIRLRPGSKPRNSNRPV
jgi:hypothetical protein